MMALQGPSTVVSLLILFVMGANTQFWKPKLNPTKLCFNHVAGVQQRQRRESNIDRCDEINGHEIACTTDCSGYEEGVEVFAVHDPSCRNIDHVSLTLIRTYYNDEGSVIFYNAGNVAIAEFQPFTSPWLQRVNFNFCPYREMFFAELNLEMDSLVDCNIGRVTQHFNVTLYNDLMRPVTCEDNHMQFWSWLPPNNYM